MPTPFVPNEPSSFSLILTGLATIGVYLCYTGKWRNLRAYATGTYVAPAEQARVRSRAKTRPSSGYPVCGYERNFAKTLSLISQQY
ncbi:MAG: hypothetical protein KDA87_15020 [Planctomycetales bacterium]|nr:hypothetical protein [Planctomycetales bacterium]